ncbi:iron export ABC transporter permease subunit FetB [Desulfuromonas carbonis]|uniref:ABC transporter permease n=1 Tax=Desulfuromonas sp. DDH964 TaxID=1823759 RepID=UPI00078E7467|nr:iron export ABC transporter permease subunit FetB [Desulfuromonas sp. DDH964]AMV71978.1 iron export ABC transporter permease subunit FetB [Desulfuromonas sp. DDH964]
MSSAGIIQLSLGDLAGAFGLILLAAALARLQGAGQGRDLLWSALRMVAQLLAVGYLLHFVFALDRPLPVLLLLLLMTGFAVQTVTARVRRRMPRFYRIVGGAILVGCGGTTMVFCTLIIGLTPWYDPRYLIPLAGMVIGNSMTGASLAAERLAGEMAERRQEIETALCLGAPARLAAREGVRNAFRAALIPSINAMAAMGIVFLPGMMTGQILSGTEPIVAVRYQIAIMCVITGSVAVTTFLILLFGARSYFVNEHQLREGEPTEG